MTFDYAAAAELFIPKKGWAYSFCFCFIGVLAAGPPSGIDQPTSGVSRIVIHL
jgi:hypothetical protein